VKVLDHPDAGYQGRRAAAFAALPRGLTNAGHEAVLAARWLIRSTRTPTTARTWLLSIVPAMA
jgi:hypothetical protein